MRSLSLSLLLLAGAVLIPACSVLKGTPTQGACRYVPTQEECQREADLCIEDKALLKCVRRLCVVGYARCGANEEIPGQCAANKAEDTDPGGYVADPLGAVPHTPELPKEEINWCELPVSPSCQQKLLVHEYAHACGWEHKQGKGVPGNEGGVDCR